MGKIPHGRYTMEFREEAARLVLEEGLSAGQAAQAALIAEKHS